MISVFPPEALLLHVVHSCDRNPASSPFRASLGGIQEVVGFDGTVQEVVTLNVQQLDGMPCYKGASKLEIKLPDPAAYRRAFSSVDIVSGPTTRTSTAVYYETSRCVGMRSPPLWRAQALDTNRRQRVTVHAQARNVRGPAFAIP